VIVTGSSGIQSIPLIAEQAAHLTVFQRTPNFSMPAKNAALDPEYVRELKAIYPAHRQEARESGFGVPVTLPEHSALDADPEERWENYRQGFEQGNLVGMMLTYNDLLTNKEANDTAAEYVRYRIREIVEDPEVAETLSPQDHPVAGAVINSTVVCGDLSGIRAKSISGRESCQHPARFPPRSPNGTIPAQFARRHRTRRPPLPVPLRERFGRRDSREPLTMSSSIGARCHRFRRLPAETATQTRGRPRIRRRVRR
jgi:cation diffusion facilitator CzcD-associated flavoprotein CzcO